MQCDWCTKEFTLEYIDVVVFIGITEARQYICPECRIIDECIDTEYFRSKGIRVELVPHSR